MRLPIIAIAIIMLLATGCLSPDADPAVQWNKIQTLNINVPPQAEADPSASSAQAAEPGGVTTNPDGTVNITGGPGTVILVMTNTTDNQGGEEIAPAISAPGFTFASPRLNTPDVELPDAIGPAGVPPPAYPPAAGKDERPASDEPEDLETIGAAALKREGGESGEL